MGILKAIGEIFGMAFGENDFVNSFKENSFWKKEDYEKTTAENTRKILELQIEQNKGLEEQARNGK